MLPGQTDEACQPSKKNSISSEIRDHLIEEYWRFLGFQRVNKYVCIQISDRHFHVYLTPFSLDRPILKCDRNVN